MSAAEASDNAVEVWCSEVAAELLRRIDGALKQALRVRKPVASGGAGGRLHSLATRASRRFSLALIESTLEGRTLYRDAVRMLGIAKTDTFNEFGRALGFRS